jgi:hypothetical protein
MKHIEKYELAKQASGSGMRQLLDLISKGDKKAISYLGKQLPTANKNFLDKFFSELPNRNAGHPLLMEPSARHTGPGLAQLLQTTARRGQQGMAPSGRDSGRDFKSIQQLIRNVLTGSERADPRYGGSLSHANMRGVSKQDLVVGNY